jgi:CRISPR-associated protein Csd1
MILHALKHHYDLKLEAGGEDAPPVFGYSAEKVGFALVLSPDGRLLDEPVDLRDTAGKKPKPAILTVPQPIKRTSGIAANFLWDKTSYVLGVASKGGDRVQREHNAFKVLHQEALAGTEDEGLLALLAFLERWHPEDFKGWSNGEIVLDANLVFRIDGERHYLHERPAARQVWSRLLGDRGGSMQTCLVTGEEAPAAVLHPAIKGVYGGQSSGGSIVSFNNNAFTSYGKSQGLNAPVSEAAAFAYTTALNQLLRLGSRNRVQIADASTVFWAEGRAGARLAELTCFGVFAGDEALEDEARGIDKETASKVGSILQQMAEGRPIDQAAPELDPETRFYVLGLCPNASRIAVRFWQCAPTARITGGGRIHPDRCR